MAVRESCEPSMLPSMTLLLKEPKRVAETQAEYLTNSMLYGMPCGTKELDLSSKALNNSHRTWGR